MRTEFAYKLDLPEEETLGPSTRQARAVHSDMSVFIVGYAADAVELTTSKMKFLNGIGYAIYVSAFDLDEQILDVSGSDLDTKLIGPTADSDGDNKGADSHVHKKKVIGHVTLTRPAAPFSKNSPYRRNKHTQSQTPTAVDELADPQMHNHAHMLTITKTASLDSVSNTGDKGDDASESSADSVSAGPPLSQLLLLQHQRQLSSQPGAVGAEVESKIQIPGKSPNPIPPKKQSIFSKMRTSSDSYSDTNSDVSTESDPDSVYATSPRELVIDTLTKAADGPGQEVELPSKVPGNTRGGPTPLGMPPTGFKTSSKNTQINSAQTISANFAAAMNISRTPSPQIHQQQQGQSQNQSEQIPSSLSPQPPSGAANESTKAGVAIAGLPITHVSKPNNGKKDNNKDGLEGTEGQLVVEAHPQKEKLIEKHKKLKYWVPSWEPLDVWAYPVALLPVLTRVPSNLTMDLFDGLRHIGDGCNSNIFLGYYKETQVNLVNDTILKVHGVM